MQKNVFWKFPEVKNRFIWQQQNYLIRKWESALRNTVSSVVKPLSKLDAFSLRSSRSAISNTCGSWSKHQVRVRVGIRVRVRVRVGGWG